MICSHKLLFVDIETYSGADLAKCGVHAYSAHPAFEILLIGYAVNRGEPVVLDLTDGDDDSALRMMLSDDSIIKVAHNAQFEMTCLAAAGYDINPESWICTQALANRAGLPPSLAALSEVLDLRSEGKLSIGRQLIRYFCVPCKPTKSNGGRTRNLPEHDRDGWEAFKGYNARDIIAERAVYQRLLAYRSTETEERIRQLDYRINRRGIRIDAELAGAALDMYGAIADRNLQRLRELTGLENPNSSVQFKGYLSSVGLSDRIINPETGRESFTKSIGLSLMDDPCVPDEVKEAVKLKLSVSKASIKKYSAMLRALCPDGTVKGMLQYYGANRTGRWAGRIVQLQNLRRNSLPDLGTARELVREGDEESIRLLWDETVPEVLGQLVRTAFIPSQGRKFIVADYSAIEARVVAWLAGERWRCEVFENDGDIYKSSYSQAFGVPVGDVDKTMRRKGKIMELALGYGGSVGALKAFGADKLGLSAGELQGLVSAWRQTSPRIVKFWRVLETACAEAITHGLMTQLCDGRVRVGRQGGCLTITLPSMRTLYYQSAEVRDGRFGASVTYMDVNQSSRKWMRTETHGGKLVENVVQAVARDLLAEAMLRLDAAGFSIVSHVHDEVIVDAPQETDVAEVESIMSTPAQWSSGLRTSAVGYEGRFYYKD